MQRVQNGHRVTVHYIGTLDNGRIFDQREDDQPLSFTIGAGEVFPALEQEMIGMAIGEVKNIHLSADQAYGLRLDENLVAVSRKMFSTERELRIGQKMAIQFGGNKQRVMRIRRIDEHDVLLDGNHDLAGCDLTFALKLVSVE